MLSPKSTTVKALYYRTTQLSVPIDHALARVTLDRQAADYSVCLPTWDASRAGRAARPRASAARPGAHGHRGPARGSGTSSTRWASQSGQHRSLSYVDSGLGFDAVQFKHPCPTRRVCPWQHHSVAVQTPRLCPQTPQIRLSHPEIPVRKRAARPTNSICSAAPQPQAVGDSPTSLPSQNPSVTA